MLLRIIQMEQGNTSIQFNCLQLADTQPVTSRLLASYKQNNLETIEFISLYENILVSVHKCETYLFFRAAVSVFH